MLLLARFGKKLLTKTMILHQLAGSVNRFSVPLEAANIQVEKIHAEFDAMLHYAIQYVSLATLEYRAVWWRLFHAPNSSEWVNALALIELLFSLPASNGKLERVFSQLNVIKSNKQVQLSNKTLVIISIS